MIAARRPKALRNPARGYCVPVVLPSDVATVDREVSERTAEPVDGYETRSPVAEMLQVSRAAATGDFQLVLDRVVAAAASIIRDAAAASIVLAERTREQMRLAAGEGLSERYLQAIASDPSLLHDGAAASAIASGNLAWVEDVRCDPRASRVRQLVIAEGIQSLLALPLKTADAVVGALSVYRTVPGQWMPAEIELLRFFAEYAANAVQTSRLIVERQEQVDGLTRLVDALRAQTHEHANRLHALHGLLRLGETSQAEALLADLLEAHRTTTCEVNRSIRVPSLSGLLVAMTGSAAQRGIVLEIDPDSSLDELPATVTAAQLITVIGNLLDNAFDAVADLPEVRRNVFLLVAQDDRHLRIEVLDHGEGLTADIDELRVRGVTTKHGHRGCGLDAVWGVVENARGDIHVASDHDGTQFVVLIPLACSFDRGERMTIAHDWRVLVVEDDPIIARVHHHIVNNAVGGFEVVAIARSGNQALEMIENLRPDLVLLDLGLPGVGGIELLRHIRGARFPTEVIAVTAASSVDMIRAALHLGVVDYLVKPFDPERLRCSLTQFVRRMAVLNGQQLEQGGVDALRSTAAPKARWLPKELQPERLEAIRRMLSASDGPVSAEDIGNAVGVARVTARRYLEYMVSVRQADCVSLPFGRGRPRKVYTHISPESAASRRI